MLIQRHSHKKFIFSITLLSIFIVLLLVILAAQLSAFNDIRRVLISTENGLTKTQQELQTLSGDLANTQSELKQTQTESAATQARLTQTGKDLVAKQAELAQTQLDLTTTQSRQSQTQNDLNSTRNELKIAVERFDSLQNEMNNLQINYDSLQTNYDRLISGYGYVFSDPTYRSLKDFISADKTNEKKYDIEGYSCEDFSNDLMVNAAKKNIRSAFVAISYTGTQGHAIVAFNTTDKGIIYIEPQTDDEVALQVGKRYHDSVMPKAGYFYPEPSFDDTVTKFIVIW